MKKLLIILCVFLSVGLYAQKKIVNIETGLYYQSSGFDQINNNIRYALYVNADSVAVDTTGTPISGIIYCPDMWAGLDGNYVEQSDVGLTGRELSYNFGTALIWGFNLLDLDLTKWQLVE